MSGEKELKPCFVPSCAKHSEKRVETFFDEGQYFVRCLNCYSQGPESRKEKEAVEGWNEIHRATPTGTEIVPEGTMLVIEKTAETIRGLMAAFAKSSEGIECRREIALHGENLGGIRALCEEILKAHRATQKDKEPT